MTYALALAGTPLFPAAASARGSDSLEAVEDQIEPEIERDLTRLRHREVLLDVLDQLQVFVGGKSQKESCPVVLEPICPAE